MGGWGGGAVARTKETRVLEIRENLLLESERNQSEDACQSIKPENQS